MRKMKYFHAKTTPDALFSEKSFYRQSKMRNIATLVLSVMVLVGAVSAATNTVIDLSHYNGNVDLKKAWDDGIRTIIHKATQGTK